MVFNSLPFYVFFTALFVVYWFVPKKFQNLLLLIASYYFYASWQPAYALILLFVTAVSYLIARYMEKMPQRKTLLLWLALFLTLGILFIFKYFNFFSVTLDELLAKWQIAVQLPQFKLLLPVGLSFYSFQIISYLVDVYRGKIKPEKDFQLFALYVSFFPQIAAGPIERSEHMLPQFREKTEFNYDRTVSGLKLFAFGLFKKVVIADNLGIAVSNVFNFLPNFKGLSLIITMVFFAWQIYADFSGYTDMARGVARMLGFDLVKNFSLPYLATSVRDFWRRWHMSLSAWFKDYLYIPLGGNKRNIFFTCVNSLIVFLVCGLWHGAAWTFILWGLFHGSVMALERLYVHFTHSKVKFPAIISILYTQIIVIISWVLFRAANVSDALYIYKSALLGAKHFLSPNYIWSSISQIFKTNVVEMAITFFCLGTIILIEIISSRTSLSGLIKKQPWVIRWTLYVVAISLIILLQDSKITEFIYLQF